MFAVVQFKIYPISLKDKNLKIKICKTIIMAVFRRVHKIAKSVFYLRHVCLSICPSVPLSVCPHGVNRLPLCGFS